MATKANWIKGAIKKPGAKGAGQSATAKRARLALALRTMRAKRK